jgi:hypothetical protein
VTAWRTTSRGRRRGFGLALAFVMAIASVGTSFAGIESSASPGASRIIDRTVMCRMAGTGFPDTLRFMDASAPPFDPGSDYSPMTTVFNGTGESITRVWVSTGPGPGPTGELSFPTRCPTAKLRVALSSRGLRAGAAEPRAWYRCDVPARVVIRVRGIFRRPTALSRDPRAPESYVARGDISTASLAVITLPGRKPMFFGSVNGATRKARAFIAPSRCARR